MACTRGSRSGEPARSQTLRYASIALSTAHRCVPSGAGPTTKTCVGVRLAALGRRDQDSECPFRVVGLNRSRGRRSGESGRRRLGEALTKRESSHFLYADRERGRAPQLRGGIETRLQNLSHENLRSFFIPIASSAGSSAGPMEIMATAQPYPAPSPALKTGPAPAGSAALALVHTASCEPRAQRSYCSDLKQSMICQAS